MPVRFVNYRIVAFPAPQSLDDLRARTATELLPASGTDPHPQARVTEKDLAHLRAHGALELRRFAFSAPLSNTRLRPSRPTQTPMWHRRISGHLNNLQTSFASIHHSAKAGSSGSTVPRRGHHSGTGHGWSEYCPHGIRQAVPSGPKTSPRRFES